LGGPKIEKAAPGGVTRGGAFSDPANRPADDRAGDHRQVEGRGAVAHAAAVFPGGHIQAQGQARCDAPVAAVGRQPWLGGPRGGRARAEPIRGEVTQPLARQWRIFQVMLLDQSWVKPFLLRWLAEPKLDPIQQVLLFLCDHRSFGLVQAGQDESSAIGGPASFLYPFPDRRLTRQRFSHIRQGFLLAGGESGDFRGELFGLTGVMQLGGQRLHLGVKGDGVRVIRPFLQKMIAKREGLPLLASGNQLGGQRQGQTDLLLWGWIKLQGATEELDG